jgi:hypothetical protein
MMHNVRLILGGMFLFYRSLVLHPRQVVSSVREYYKGRKAQSDQRRAARCASRRPIDALRPAARSERRSWLSIQGARSPAVAA